MKGRICSLNFIFFWSFRPEKMLGFSLVFVEAASSAPAAAAWLRAARRTAEGGGSDSRGP